MDWTVLAPWRDLSLIYLLILPIVITGAIAVGMYYAVRGMRFVNRWLKTPLLYAQVWALRIQHATTRASYNIAEVPIRMHSNSEQTRIVLRGVIDYLQGK
jgi:hypothetical protein